MMKKLGAILLTLLLLLGMYPQTAVAAQSPDFEQELTKYLGEISTERGFEVTKEDLLPTLAVFDLTLEDFNTISELRAMTGEVIKADLSNLKDLYEEYKLDEASLRQLLSDNGDDLNDYIFTSDLDFAVYYYTDNETFERDPNFDQSLEVYLSAISTERGFEVSKDKLISILAGYSTSLEEFETVDDLSDFLGDVIKTDLSNLETYYASEGLDKQSILKLIEDNGHDINDYVYLYDLGDAIWPSDYPVVNEDMINKVLEQIGLTSDELQKIEAYFTSLEDYFANPDTLNRFLALGERIKSLEDVAISAPLTKEQTAEIISIYEEYLSILKIDMKFSLIKDGAETPVTIKELINLKELNNNKLKISLYGVDTGLLADFIISEDLLKMANADLGSLIEDASSQVTSVLFKAPTTTPVTGKDNVVKTVKGAQLPKTASDYIPNAILGLFVAIAGLLMYRKLRMTEDRTTRKEEV